jgi:hypothetical protein
MLFASLSVRLFLYRLTSFWNHHWHVLDYPQKDGWATHWKISRRGRKGGKVCKREHFGVKEVTGNFPRIDTCKTKTKMKWEKKRKEIEFLTFRKLFPLCLSSNFKKNIQCILFIRDPFNDAISNEDQDGWWMMNCRGCGRKQLWPISILSRVWGLCD